MFLRKLGPLALCLLLVLPLAACGADPGKEGEPSSGGDANIQGQEAAMGRYVEEAAGLPAGANTILDIHQLRDGTLQMLAGASTFKILGPWDLYTSADGGKTWAKKEAPYLSQLDNAGGPDIAYDREDNLYMSYTEYTPEIEAMFAQAQESGVMPDPSMMPKPQLVKITPEGTVTNIPLDWFAAEGEAASVSGIAVADNGDILINHYSWIAQYDPVTGERKNAFQPKGWLAAFTIIGDTLVAVNRSPEYLLQQFSLTTGEALEDIPLGSVVTSGAKNTNSGELLLTSLDGKSLYLQNSSGIFRFVVGGSMWERVVEGELTSLGLPSMRCGQLLELSSGDFLALFSDEDGHQLLHYRYDESVPTVPSEELAVYSLRDSGTLRQAIGLYQRAHPDTRVRFSPTLEQAGAVTQTDAVRALNTELLAGKGPDLLVLDGLPVGSYLAKGVLADLGDVVSPLVEKGALLGNKIPGDFQIAGKPYAVPARYSVPCLWADAALLEKADGLEGLAAQLEALKQQNPGQDIMELMAPGDLMRTFYPVCAPAWLDGEGNLDREALVQFITQIKRVAASDGRQEAGQVSDPVWSLLPWAHRVTQVSAGLSQSFQDIATGQAAAEKRGDGALIPLPGQAKGVYVPKTILGVNAQSPRAGQAKEILALALSEEVQHFDFEGGYPINAAAFAASAQNPYHEGDDGMFYTTTYTNEDGTVSTQELDLQVIWPSADYMEAVMGQIRALETPCLQDDVLLEMVIEETGDFFTGGKTAEEAADAVIERTEAYLSE